MSADKPSPILDANGKPFRWDVAVASTADQRTDKEKGLHHHDMDTTANTKNFDSKIYMFPESYNALRRELFENWQLDIWPYVSWSMAFAANIFVERMNEVLDLRVVLDSDKVDAICVEYLNALRAKRGVSKL